jgi:arylsulfatase A-like enzyme
VNVVAIMNDTWRYDYVGANGNDEIHTPVLDQFAAESAVFDRSHTGWHDGES